MTLLFLSVLSIGGFVIPAVYYNNLYIRDLIRSGYKARSIVSGDFTLAESKVRMRIPRFEG